MDGRGRFAASGRFARLVTGVWLLMQIAEMAGNLRLVGMEMAARDPAERGESREESGAGMAGSDLPSPHADLPSLEHPRGDGDGGASGAGMLWRGRTFHLHTRTFLPWSSRAGMAMAGRRGRRERATAGRTVHQNVCTSTLSSYRVVEIDWNTN
jgi:hypothetical protein